MRKICLGIFLATSTVPFVVGAATITFGDGVVLPVNGTDGTRVEAGRNGGGTVTIDGGTTINLESGSSTDELVARPKIDVGDGGTGTVTITGTGTAVNLIVLTPARNLRSEPTGMSVH